MIEERRQGLSKSNFEGDGQADLLGIFISNDLYKDDNEKIINESLAFLFAGTETIAISTTNLLFYLNQNPSCKEKLLAEIESVMKDKKDI